MRRKYQKKMQDGGKINYFDYKKTGDTNISANDVASINQSTGIQFTPEFSQAYFSNQSAPQQVNTPTNYTQRPIIDITSDGQFTDRKVWRTQRPEWFVGKQEPIEGKDYTTVPYKQWSPYQKSSEYASYMGQASQNNQLAEMKEGGMLPQYQNSGMTPPSNQFTDWLGSLGSQTSQGTNFKQPTTTSLQSPNTLFSNYGTPTTWAMPQSTSTPVQQKQAISPTTTVVQPTTTAPQQATAVTPTTTTPTTTQAYTGFNYVQGDYNLNSEANTLDNMDKFGAPTGATNKDFQYIQGDANLSGGVDSQDKVDSLGNPLQSAQQAEGQQPFQFSNPYAGVNIPQAAGYLGESIANKDALGIASSGLKLATGLARNIGMGLGSANRQNQVMKSYAESQRDTVTGANRPQVLSDQGSNEGLGYYQEGGSQQNPQEQMLMQVAEALQGGAQPEEVLQQLVTNGIPEEQANQLIEMVMQELQGQQEQPQMKKGGNFSELKGKRILDYKLDEQGNYIVEYED
jgi:hypothetical protein